MLELLNLPKDVWDLIIFEHGVSFDDLLNLLHTSQSFRPLIERYISVISNDISHPVNGISAKLNGLNANSPSLFTFDNENFDFIISSSVLIIFNIFLEQPNVQLDSFLKIIGQKCTQFRKFFKINLFLSEAYIVEECEFKYVVGDLQTLIHNKEFFNFFQPDSFLGYSVCELDPFDSCAQNGNNNGQIAWAESSYVDKAGWSLLKKVFIELHSNLNMDLFKGEKKHPPLPFVLENAKFENLTCLWFSSTKLLFDSSSEYYQSNFGFYSKIPACFINCDFPELTVFWMNHTPTLSFKYAWSIKIQSLINCHFDKLTLLKVNPDDFFIARNVEMNNLQVINLGDSTTASLLFPYMTELTKKYSIDSNRCHNQSDPFYFKMSTPKFSYLEVTNLDFGDMKNVVSLSLQSLGLFHDICRTISSLKLEDFKEIKISCGKNNLGTVILLNELNGANIKKVRFKSTTTAFNDSTTHEGREYDIVGLPRVGSIHPLGVRHTLPFRAITAALDCYYSAPGWTSRFSFVPYYSDLEIKVQWSAKRARYIKPPIVQVSPANATDQRIERGAGRVFHYRLEDSVYLR